MMDAKSLSVELQLTAEQRAALDALFHQASMAAAAGHLGIVLAQVFRDGACRVSFVEHERATKVQMALERP